MPRFNFTNITSQSKVSISDIMDNFNRVESLGITEAEVNSQVAMINQTINAKAANLKRVATTSADGLMSASDKSKLNGIEQNANRYVLPVASSELGGVRTASSVTSPADYTPVPIINGVPYYKDTNTTYDLASQSNNGLMSYYDKRRLDSMELGANNYILPTASTTLGGVKTTSPVTSNSGYTACPIISGVPYYKDTNTTYSAATTSANGLMTATMVTKLNGIATGATAVSVTDNLTSDSATNALSAKQGKALKTLVDAKQKAISRGTNTPSGGSNGDYYIQYF